MREFVPFLENPLTDAEASDMSPLVLAFVGDGVQQLFVRARLAASGRGKAGEMHRHASEEINAIAQARAADRLLPLLTEEEAAVYRRARNARYTTTAKHAGTAEYKKASAFEAVAGWLYLTGRRDRLAEILSSAREEEP